MKHVIFTRPPNPKTWYMATGNPATEILEWKLTIVFNRPYRDNQCLKIFHFWCPKPDKIPPGAAVAGAVLPVLRRNQSGVCTMSCSQALDAHSSAWQCSQLFPKPFKNEFSLSNFIQSILPQSGIGKAFGTPSFAIWQSFSSQMVPHCLWTQGERPRTAPSCTCCCPHPQHTAERSLVRCAGAGWVLLVSPGTVPHAACRGGSGQEEQQTCLH